MITFLGDVALLNNRMKSEYKPSNPYVINCEYVIGIKEELTPIPGKINLCSENKDFLGVFGRNPIIATLANNHINDYGEKGVDSTIDALRSLGVLVLLDSPIIIDNNICILAYMDLQGKTYGKEQFFFDKQKALKDINDAKSKGHNTIIVLMHWGIENDPNPTLQQKECAHWLIDNGVKLIIGHHPHCVQNVEEYKGKKIFYSLGNGLFSSINTPSHYSEQGKATRTYRFKWQKWNRISYAVTIDDNANVTKIEELKQTKSGVLKRNKTLQFETVINKKPKPRFVYIFRKYFLFLVSNLLVDGKLFDVSAIKAELKK